MSLLKHYSKAGFPRPLPGDWLVIALGIALVLTLFITLWHAEPAANPQEQAHGAFGIESVFEMWSLSQKLFSKSLVANDEPHPRPPPMGKS